MKEKRCWRFVGIFAISVSMAIVPFVYLQGAESQTELENKVQVEMISYTREADLTISSAEELNEFARKVNNGNSYAGKLVRLSEDIQFDGVTVNNFMPIGDTYDTRFEGTFDGGGYTVSGIIVVNDGYTAEAVGLFGCLGKGATVKNINIKDSEFTNNKTGSVTAAAVVGRNLGTVNNCHNRYTKINSSGYKSGGIVGENERYGTVVNCSSTGDVISTCDDFIAYTGGVVGNNEGTIYNSCNIGSVNSVNGMAGGITGGDNNINSALVQNCYNTGIITSGNDKSGGIIGKVIGTVANCYCSEESSAVNFYEINGTEQDCEVLPAVEMRAMSFMNLLNANRGNNKEWMEWEFCSEESIYPIPAKYVSLFKCQIMLDNNSFIYDGTAKRPEVTIVYNEEVLTEGINYTLSYQNNINAGEAAIILEGIGRYTDIGRIAFTIAKKDIAEKDISVSPANLNYNGKAQKPSVVVKSNNKTLTYGTDYTLTYRNNTNAGTAEVTVEGKGNYTGSVTKTFAIGKANQGISGTKTYKKAYGDKKFSLDAKTTGDGKLTYSSSDKKVAIVDKNGKVTIKGTGIAVITVKAGAAANYNANTAGMKVTLNVSPARQIIKSIKAAKGKKLTIKWKKDTKATGYQIQYCTDKKFKKGVKTVDIKKNKTTSNTIAKLKKGQKYYVRVCSYKTVKANGKTTKLYGKWSSVKRSANIKK